MDADFAMYQKLLSEQDQNSNVVARFYDRWIKTDRLGKDGLPIFETKTFIEIRIRDNTTEVYDQPATEEKKKRFPLEFSRYQIEKKQVENGTPLEMFAFLDAGEVASLKVRGIFTVETLAELKEEYVKNLGLEREKELAIKFLEGAKMNMEISDFAEKEEKYKAEIERLKDEIRELKEAKKKA